MIKCFFCFGLRTGSILTGIYTIFVSTQAICLFMIDENGARPHQLSNSVFPIMVDTICFFFVSVSSLGMLYGVVRRKPKLLLVWFMVMIMCVGSMAVHTLHMLITADIKLLLQTQAKHHFLVLVCSTVALLLNMNGFFCVVAYYRTIIEPENVLLGDEPTATGTQADDYGDEQSVQLTVEAKMSISNINVPEEIEDLSREEMETILTESFVDHEDLGTADALRSRVKLLFRANLENQAKAAIILESLETFQATGSCDLDADDLYKHLCKVCWDALIDCVFLECGHMVACTKCGRKLEQCPMCRSNIKRAVHIFTT